MTDIVLHGQSVYSERADSLVRKIVELGGRDEIADMLLVEYHDLQSPDVPKLERVLAHIHERLLREARDMSPFPYLGT